MGRISAATSPHIVALMRATRCRLLYRCGDRARTCAAVYVLLCGGEKSSQRRDIAAAKRMARELKESGR